MTASRPLGLIVRLLRCTVNPTGLLKFLTLKSSRQIQEIFIGEKVMSKEQKSNKESKKKKSDSDESKKSKKEKKDPKKHDGPAK
jgi:hypothetical protein